MKKLYFLDSKKELKRIEAKFDETTALSQLLKMGFKNQKTFLDIGCGGGAMTRLVKKTFPKSRVIGVDSNPDRINFAKMKAKRLKLDITYICANVYSLPLNNNTIDFIWSRFLFEYLGQPLKALTEMKRIAKINASVCVGDLDGNCMFHYPQTKQFQHKLNLAVKKLSSFGFDPFIGRKLYSYFRKVGFKKICVHIYPYHNIAGKIHQKALNNWTSKVDLIGDFLKKTSLNKSNFIGAFKKDFISFIKDPDTFTYSILIFVKGLK